LALALIAISAQPMEAPPVASLPVSFISDKDLSQITQGAKNAKKLKVDVPKPLADKIDVPKPVEELAPKVADKPEIKTETAAKPPQQQPEPQPKVVPKPAEKPEQKTADKPIPKPAEKPDQKLAEKPLPKPSEKPDQKLAEKPLPKPAEKPDQKPAEKPDKPKTADYKPDQIAQILKKEDAKKPPKPDDKPVRDAPKFDASQVAQLLDHREPRRQIATAETLNDTPNVGTSAGAAAQLSQSEIDALRARIASCWNPPAGVDAASKVYVVLRVFFRPDGAMAQEPALVEATASALGPALAESAKRALLMCQPFTMLRPEHYDQWKDLELKFDPKELLGG
jgi:colicin import membrane protein